MENNFVIFLFVATAAQSSIALNFSNSCVPRTSIGADLAVIRFSNDLSHNGLVREVEIIFTLIRTLIAELAGEVYVNPEYAELRFELAKNETLTAGTVPITPLYEGIRTVQPGIDIKSYTQRATAIIASLVTDYFQGMKLAQGKNYSVALNAIEETEKEALAVGDSFYEVMFNALLNGNVKIRPEDESVIACAHAKAASTLRDGSSGIFDGAKLLLKAYSCQTSEGLSGSSSEIENAFNKAFDGLTSSVEYGIAAIRNFKIATFMNKTGVLNGLYAIQATSCKINV